MTLPTIQRIVLYKDYTDEPLDIRALADYVKVKLRRVRVETRESPLADSPERNLHCARQLASARVHDVRHKLENLASPFDGEVRFEQRKILGQAKGAGVLYDGFLLQRVFLELMPARDVRPEVVSIFITDRLFVTWQESDKRYHLRTSLYGIPSVISTSGLVEAPAKPRDYYFLKQQCELLGKDLLELKELFRESCLSYGDDRLAEVIKGYIMQGVFYVLTGDPYCDDRSCRLYNAHWQEEVIFAQLESKHELCRHHDGVLVTFHSAGTQSGRPCGKDRRVSRSTEKREV